MYDNLLLENLYDLNCIHDKPESIVTIIAKLGLYHICFLI